MVRHATSQGEAVLQRIKPIHLATALVLAAMFGELLDVISGNRIKPQKVTVQTQNPFCLAQMMNGLNTTSENQPMR